MIDRNFLLCSDNNYWEHLLVTAVSIFSSQRKDVNVNVYVLGNGLSHSNIEQLEQLAQNYNNSSVHIIDVSDFYEKITGKVNTELTINVYIRLFATEYLPPKIGKILYLDVDTFVMEDLSALWNISLDDYMMAAVKSTMDLRDSNDDNPSHDHINSGVLFFDVQKWREEHVVTQFLDVIEANRGSLPFHDGTVLNLAFKGKILYLPLRYNFTTPLRYLPYKRLISLYGLTSYYSRETYIEAKKYPAIIHATSWIMGRPWDMRSCSPYKKQYFDFLNMTGSSEEDNRLEAPPFRQRFYTLIRFLYYRFCPTFIMKYKKGIKKDG